jgi:DUF971 family protein
MVRLITQQPASVSAYGHDLAVVSKANREVKIMPAQQLHYGLQVVLAVAHDAHGVALDLGLYFGVGVT